MGLAAPRCLRPRPPAQGCRRRPAPRGLVPGLLAPILLAWPARGQAAWPAAAIAQAITVQVLAPVPSSGTLIKREGDRYTVLTAWHGLEMVQPGEAIDVQAPDGQVYALAERPRRLDPGLDLGLLVFTSRRSYRVARPVDGAMASPGVPVIVAGFPLPTATITVRTFRLREGRIEGLLSAATAQQGYRLLYNVVGSTLPGMSGGPVLRADGGLLGIHGRAELSSTGTDQESVALRSGTSLGIPIDAVLAERLGLRLETAPPPASAAVSPAPPAAVAPVTVRERVVIREPVVIQEPVREPGDLGAPCISYLYSTLGFGSVPLRCQREVETLNRFR